MALVLTIASFGSSLLWVLTANARRRGAIGSSGVVRGSFATALEGPSFLGVFLL